jgi:hypothetical protein
MRQTNSYRLKARAISMSENFVGKHPVWRGNLLPLGYETAPKPDSPFLPDIPYAPDYDDCVAVREQAPSPQVRVSRPTGRLWMVKLLPRVDLSLTAVSDGFRSPNEKLANTV